MIGKYRIAVLCAAKIYEEQTVAFIKALNSVLVEHDWRLMICATDSDLYYRSKNETGEAYIFEIIDFALTDALVVMHDSILNSDILDMIYDRGRAHGVPTVTVDNIRAGCTGVRFDYEGGFEAIVKHILDHHGVKDLYMFAGNKGLIFSEIRIDIVRTLCLERNIPFGEDRISYCDYWAVPTAAACEKLIAAGRLPQALICANDTMAISACRVFRDHGIRIPEDMIVTGFDGIEEANYTTPRITTARCDFGELGEKVGEVITCGNGGEEDIIISPKPVFARSCGCPDDRVYDAATMITRVQADLQRYHMENRRLIALGECAQGSRSFDEIEKRMKSHILSEMTCVLRKECGDPSKNPLVRIPRKAESPEMYILYDSRNGDGITKKREFMQAELIPGIEDLFPLKTPFIFSALHFSDVPLGYNCFYYKDVSMENYMKVGQICACMSSVVDSYRTMLYQQYLLKRIEDMYKFDTMTGFCTRTGFLKEYERIVKKGRFTAFTLVLCDLDGLKHINDSFGHSEGDSAIITVAKALRYACPDAVCSKYGGDELIALLTEKGDREAIREAIERYIGNYNSSSGKPYKVSVSIGIAVSDTAGDFEKLFGKADSLMYIEKAAKKRNNA